MDDKKVDLSEAMIEKQRAKTSQKTQLMEQNLQ